MNNNPETNGPARMPGSEKERGSALILAIFVMVILMVLGLAMVFKTQQDNQIAKNYASNQKGMASTESALSEVKARMNAGIWADLDYNLLGTIVDPKWYDESEYANPDYRYFLTSDTGTDLGVSLEDTLFGDMVTTAGAATATAPHTWVPGDYYAKNNSAYTGWQDSTGADVEIYVSTASTGVRDAIQNTGNVDPADATRLLDQLTYQAEIKNATVEEVINDFHMPVLEVQWDTAVPEDNDYGTILGSGTFHEIDLEVTADATKYSDWLVRVNYNRIRSNQVGYEHTDTGTGITRTYYFFTTDPAIAANMPADKYEPFPVSYVTVHGTFSEGKGVFSQDGSRRVTSLMVPPAPDTGAAPSPLVGYIEIDQTGLSSGYISGVNVGADACDGPPAVPGQISTGGINQGNTDCDDCPDTTVVTTA